MDFITVMDIKHWKMERLELIALGHKIVNCEGTEEEIDKMISDFNRNVPHPDGANLFFYPENYNFRSGSLSDYNPTVEEVVERALNYKTIKL